MSLFGFPYSLISFGDDAVSPPPAPPYAAPEVDVLAILDGAHSSLEQFVWLSLFSNARAHDDDVLPDGADRGGWWGDTYAAPDTFGSRLWLLDRAVVTQDAILRAADYAREALAWLVTDGLAVAVDVQTARFAGAGSGAGISLRVTVTRGDQTPAEVYKFANIWSVIND